MTSVQSSKLFSPFSNTAIGCSESSLPLTVQYVITVPKYVPSTVNLTKPNFVVSGIDK